MTLDKLLCTVFTECKPVCACVCVYVYARQRQGERKTEIYVANQVMSHAIFK